MSEKNTIQRCALGLGLILFSQVSIPSMAIIYLQIFGALGGLGMLICMNLKSKGAKFGVFLVALILGLYYLMYR